MNIRNVFEQAKSKGQKLFIPYLTCGDPDLQTTITLITELEKVGADIIELGVPFSDPMADGVINQLSAQRALKNNVSLKDCCLLVKTLRDRHCHIPIVLFTYFNPLFRIGLKTFASLAHTCGINGVLVVDLPVEEASELISSLSIYHIDNIFLASPTTEKNRLQQIANANTSFLYYVSRVGTTGVQSSLSSTLEKELREIKKRVDIPIAIGFGISTPAQAKEASMLAEGVIVGSALVKTLAHPEKAQAVSDFITLAIALAQAVHSPCSERIST